jgi:hypothetical protein
MNRTRLVAIIIVFTVVVLFIPIIKVVVVPQWTIHVVNEAGDPQGDVDVRQHWRHYSFDGSGINDVYGGEEVRSSDLNGEIVFPERAFRASALSWLAAKVGSPERWINIHSSTGPSSYFICMNASCDVGPSYRGRERDLENNVLTVESEDTIHRLNEESIRRLDENPLGLPVLTRYSQEQLVHTRVSARSAELLG